VVVPVPPAGEMLLATFRLSLPFSWEVENAVFEAPALWLSTGSARLRLVPGTAGDLHVLRPASTLGFARRFVPRGIRSFEVTGGPGGGDGAVVVSFYEAPEAPA
jgi:hypothetical protein